MYFNIPSIAYITSVLFSNGRLYLLDGFRLIVNKYSQPVPACYGRHNFFPILFHRKYDVVDIGLNGGVQR